MMNKWYEIFIIKRFSSTDFLLKINKKKLVQNEAEKSNLTRFKICQRKNLVGYRIQRLHPPIEQRAPQIVSSSSRPIIIQYGHPVSTKKMKKSHARAEGKKEVLQNAENLRSFNQRVVVIKGHLKKPITNMRRTDFFPNFNTLML